MITSNRIPKDRQGVKQNIRNVHGANNEKLREKFKQIVKNALRDFNIREKLDARRFHLGKPPPLPRTIYAMAGKVIATPGNLLELSANNKTCKTTYLTSGFIAASFGQEGDTLGIKSENPNKYALIHFDTEQSPFHQYKVVEVALSRVGIVQHPYWLRSYRLADLGPSELVEMLECELHDANEEHGGIHSVLLDGVADFVVDVNSSKDCPEFVTKLHRLAIEYDTVIVCILHLNPGSDFKSRGHLGSQLERKSETVLRLEKKDAIFTAYTAASRNAPIYKEDGVRFEWSEEKGRHVALERTARVEKMADSYRELDALAKAVFADGPLEYREAWRKIRAKQKKSASEAKRILGRMRSYGFIEQITEKRGAPWRLKKS